MKQTVGVIVGRFQLAELHKGHRHLIDTAISENNKLLILVGVHDGQPTNNNPLDFETRKSMLLGSFPNCTVLPIYDVSSDQYWSEQLEQQVADCFPEHEPVLYGSRDSFLDNYTGALNKRYVEELPPHSATKAREEGIDVVDDHMFRHGAIHATVKQRYPTAYQAIDVAIRHSTEDKILLGRKAGEEKWCFIGGFVEPKDDSLESAVRREVSEETGDIEIDDITYISSRLVADRRYHGSSDSVISAFFSATYISGEPKELMIWRRFTGFQPVNLAKTLSSHIYRYAKNCSTHKE